MGLLGEWKEALIASQQPREHELEPRAGLGLAPSGVLLGCRYPEQHSHCSEHLPVFAV